MKTWAVFEGFVADYRKRRKTPAFRHGECQ